MNEGMNEVTGDVRKKEDEEMDEWMNVTERTHQEKTNDEERNTKIQNEMI